MKQIEMTGKTINEAVDNACAELGVSLLDVDYKVLEEPSKGFLGIGAKLAKVLVTVTSSEDEEPEKPAKAEKPEKSKDATDKNIKSIIKTAKQIISESAEADGWMHFSAFMNEIRRKENDFNPKLYGFQNSRPIQFFKSLTEKRKAIFTLERKNNVDKIKINKED